MFLYLTDCLTNIFHFLTIYEFYNILMTCKELRTIYFDSNIWKKLFERDLLFMNMNIGEFSKEQIIQLECGLICFPCFIKGKLYPHQCNEEINISNLHKEYFVKKNLLTPSILSKKPQQIRRIDIMKFLATKFHGITNYLFYKEKEKSRLSIKQRKNQLKSKLKYDRFQDWKFLYNLDNLRFVDCTNASERLELLQLEFRKFNLEIRDDSRLCTDYVNGNVLIYGPEFIAGAMKINSYLFSYHFKVYNEFHSTLYNLLMYKMFLRRNDINFTIKDGVDFVLRKYEKVIEKYHKTL